MLCHALPPGPADAAFADKERSISLVVVTMVVVTAMVLIAVLIAILIAILIAVVAILIAVVAILMFHATHYQRVMEEFAHLFAILSPRAQVI